MKLPRIQSTYGILDVMRGRKKLAKHLAKHGPVRVTIEATITDAYGSDDGDSIEFNMDVQSVRLEQPGDYDRRHFVGTRPQRAISTDRLTQRNPDDRRY